MRKALLLVMSALTALCLSSCAKPATQSGASESTATAEDFVQIDSDTSPEEKRFLEFGRTVVLNIAARDYAAFYGQLSSHARAQMSLNQFAPTEDRAAFQRNEDHPRLNPSLSEFIELMAVMEKERGRPGKPLDLHVFTTDPDILAGRKKEALDAVEIMFAIGSMPKLAADSLRRASLRAQLMVELSAEQLAVAAKAYDTAPADLAKDPDFQPHLTLKLVLVEEDGELHVGYFEFLPPSMLD